MRQCFSPCYQQRRSNGKKPDVPSWLPWNKQLFCHWQQWESLWLLHPSIQNQCFLLCYVFSGSAQTQIIMFLPFEDEEFARGKFSSCVMLSAQLWSFGGCDPPSDVHAQLCAFEPCRSTQGCVRARHIGFCSQQCGCGHSCCCLLHSWSDCTDADDDEWDLQHIPSPRLEFALLCVQQDTSTVPLLS